MLQNTEKSRGESQVRRLLADAVEKLETALDRVKPAQGRAYPLIVDASVEEALRQASAAALETAESMRSLRTSQANQPMPEVLEGRALALVKWFSLTPGRMERVAHVMSFFRDRTDLEPISLADLGKALGWTQKEPRHEDLLESFRKLDCMRDVGMLIETKIESERFYALSDEARALIRSGAFAGLGVTPESSR